jgi:hypothetical protein
MYSCVFYLYITTHVGECSIARAEIRVLAKDVTTIGGGGYG